MTVLTEEEKLQYAEEQKKAQVLCQRMLADASELSE